MKKLILFFILISSTVKSQDNLMFDSLDYFIRNKIKTVHYYVSPWYYSPPWHYIKMSFDKNTNSLKCDSIGFNDSDSPMTKYFNKSSQGRSFVFKDTIIVGEHGEYNDTIQHFYDKKGRLKQIKIKSAELKQNILVTTTNPNFKEGSNEITPLISNTNYFYSDDSTKKIKRIITENNYYKQIRDFYYSQSFLSTRTSLDSNKIDKQISFETTVYDYYPDKKLKKETRRISTERCPNICEGFIEYKYDTEFPNDSTPSGIKPIVLMPLMKIKNDSKEDICVLITGYNQKKKSERKRIYESVLNSDKSFELLFDSISDKVIHPFNNDSHIYYNKNDFKQFEILVYKKPQIDYFNPSLPKDTIHFEKCRIGHLFKMPKEIINK